MTRTLATIATSLLLFACPSPSPTTDGGGSDGGPRDAGGTAHTYNGSAAAGDFVTITVDRTAQTIAWTNHSRGSSGSSAFTIADGGALLVTDATAELVRAYEIPGYALVAEDQKARDGAQRALVFAFEQQAATKSAWANLTLNALQFRTREGGIEVGCFSIGADGTMTGSNYLPANDFQLPPTNDFRTANLPGTIWTEDSVNGVLTATLKPQEPPSTLFLTSAGFFGLDAAGGSIFMLNAAPSSAFDPARAGTYAAMGYDKTGESLGAAIGTQAYGVDSFFEDTITVGADGKFTPLNGSQFQLAPFKGSAFQGPGKVVPDGNGLFVFSDAAGKGDVFVGFLGDVLLFASFKKLTDATATAPGTYRYSYGVALRQ